MPISDDEAGGGPNDVEQPSRQYGYDLTAILYQREVQAHPKQGFHIKLSVEVLDAKGDPVPGAAKHKVFWLAPCTTAAPETLRISKAQEGTGQGPFSFDLVCNPPALEPDVHAGGRRQTRHHDAAWHDLRRVGDR